jgi:hypothetical protein
LFGAVQGRKSAAMGEGGQHIGAARRNVRGGYPSLMYKPGASAGGNARPSQGLMDDWCGAFLQGFDGLDAPSPTAERPAGADVPGSDVGPRAGLSGTRIPGQSDASPILFLH